MSDSLQPRGLQHARLSCPSLFPRVCSNSCPLTQWWHLTVSSSVIPLCCLQSFPASGSFQWICSSHQVVKVWELQLQHQSFHCLFYISIIYIYIYVSYLLYPWRCWKIVKWTQDLKEISILLYSLQHWSQQPRYGNNCIIYLLEA